MTNINLMTMQEKMESVIKWNEDFYTKQAESGNHGKRWVNNRINKVVEKMDSIKSANDVSEIKIKVEWKKSRTWGMNPNVTVEVFSKTEEGYTRRDEYTSSASGCGYDKESHAVGTAFDESPELLKLLYLAMEVNSENKPYGVNDYETGFSYGKGVGMSCYRNIANWLGAEWSEEHVERFSFYSMKF